MNDRIKPNFRARQDPLSGHDTVITTEHRYIHDGDFFIASNVLKDGNDDLVIPTLGANSEQEFLVVVGEDPLHFLMEIEIDKSRVIVQPHEDVDITADTDNDDEALRLVAPNRVNVKDAGCDIYEMEGTFDDGDKGTDYEMLMPWVMEAEEGVGARTVPVVEIARFEYILKPETKYVWNIENDKSTEITMFEVIFSWYVER